METLAPAEFASPETEPGIHLLLERDRADDWHRWRSAAIYSALAHVVLIIALLLMPESEMRTYEQPPPPLRVVHLYTPRDLTQKAPNNGKLSKELSVEAIPPHPLIRTPLPAPPVKVVRRPAALPAPQVAKAPPKPVIVEPPKLDAPKIQLPGDQTDQIAKFAAPPPPPPPGQAKPAFENVPSATPAPRGANGKPGGIAVPNPSVENAIRELNRSGGVSGRQSVGDSGADAGGLGLNLPPSAGRPRSNLELRSDPMGVDFRPYMLQVLAAVRRNWFAVYPEAARLGQRGQVVLEFAIAKQGLVTKVIFSTESGAKALDQSAVAAISASNPLPPLPTEFRGDRIVLRMTFMYNMPR